jgi:hypothetical protein
LHVLPAQISPRPQQVPPQPFDAWQQLPPAQTSPGWQQTEPQRTLEHPSPARQTKSTTSHTWSCRQH